MSHSLWRDERAIEGLPIRLVIALVVGVACLGVMMSTISGLSGLQVSEVDIEPDPEVTDPGDTDVTVTVVDPEGSPVSGATVVAKSGTATLDSVTTAETGDDGEADLSLSPSLGPNQQEGTVTFGVKPPSSGSYRDERSNTELLVVADR
ncbi:Ig domain-containing protein group 1 domain-containing protein [Halobacteriales archaeon QH_8_67_36]|nr:MAG: Ig domain-containing protein group 1 domain-containing protein [Halobacteriales archaeon QH_8_67_36]